MQTFHFPGRKWQNSPHSSRSPWVQTLKDLMRPAIPAPPVMDPSHMQRYVLDKEESSPPTPSGASSSDVVPDNFMGIPDVPPHDGGSSEPWLLKDLYKWFVRIVSLFPTICFNLWALCLRPGLWSLGLRMTTMMTTAAMFGEPFTMETVKLLLTPLMI